MQINLKGGPFDGQILESTACRHNISFRLCTQSVLFTDALSANVVQLKKSNWTTFFMDMTAHSSVPRRRKEKEHHNIISRSLHGELFTFFFVENKSSFVLSSCGVCVKSKSRSFVQPFLPQ